MTTYTGEPFNPSLLREVQAEGLYQIVKREKINDIKEEELRELTFDSPDMSLKDRMIRLAALAILKVVKTDVYEQFPKVNP